MGTKEEHPEKIRHHSNQSQSLDEDTDYENGDFEAGEQIYQSIFDTLPFGCSLNKIRYDSNNKPATFTILKVNQAFETALGKQVSILLPQPVHELFDGLPKKWITKFAAVAKSGKKREFIEFTFDGNTFFDIQVHSPKPHYFTLSLIRQFKKNQEESSPIHFYERLMDHLHEGIWVTDKHDNIFFANSGVTFNTGAKRANLIGRNILDFKKPNLGNFLQDYLLAKKDLNPRKYESQLVTHDGQEAVLAGWLVPLVKNDRYDGMICTTRNISDDKKNRQIIRESEQKLRNIVEHSTNVFYSHTTDHRLTYVSPQIEKLLGYSPQDALVKWTTLASDNPINQRGLQLVEKAIETGQIQEPYELELVHKDGSPVWVEVREAPVVEDGKTSSIVGALINVTEQRKIAWELKQNQEGLRNLVDDSPIPIAINGKAGQVEYLNHEFTRTFGYTTEDIPNNDRWFEKAYPDAEYRKKMKRLWKIDLQRPRDSRASHSPFEARVTCKDGSVKFVQILWNCVGDKLVLILNNLTEHKQLEEQILHKNDELQNALNELRKLNGELQVATQKAKESDELKSAFLANMSHEIRTPMNSIIGFSSLLAQPNVSQEKQEQYTNFIQKAGKHLLRIIDDIIDIAKIESNQLKIEMSYFSVVPFLQNTYDYHRQSSLLRNKPQLRLNLNYQKADKPVIMFTDPIRLKQVFDNLLTNSIKNTNEGVIEMGIHALEENVITFYVADTGIGIPEKFKQSIFKRFTQVESKTLKPGTGLGLSIIKGITNLLEGEIWFESTENKGTTFYVKFPILPKE